MLTVIGLLVSSIIQRQVRLYLHTHGQQVPGNKGTTAIPTAAVVLSLFAQVALVQVWIDDQVLAQVYGVQAHHLLLCNALGLDASWYEVPSAYKSGQGSQTPLRVRLVMRTLLKRLETFEARGHQNSSNTCTG
jgi:hypothetical protein